MFYYIEVHLLDRYIQCLCVFCLFYCIKLYDFRNRDSVVEIGRLFKVFHLR
jgi:hypothetical protein